jgi:hypothetical protein
MAQFALGKLRYCLANISVVKFILRIMQFQLIIYISLIN